jgi:hypothetical protein
MGCTITLPPAPKPPARPGEGSGAILGEELEDVARFAILTSHESVVIGNAQDHLRNIGEPTKRRPGYKVTIAVQDHVADALEGDPATAGYDLIFLVVPRSMTAEMRRRRDSRIVLPGEGGGR